MKDSSRPGHRRDASEPSFVVADPDTVFRDALHYTSWTETGGSLPQRGEWSTYRLAAKDIVLGVVTHRFNTTTRQLDIRAYFSGEHPIFEEFEPTRALLAVLQCQAYQAGGSLALNFEQGIPFDVRTLIERSTGLVLSGHETAIPIGAAESLFFSLSGLSDGLRTKLAETSVPLPVVCYQVLRGVWSPYHLDALHERGVPLAWLFRRTPSPIVSAAPFAHLTQHLRAVLLEEYALRRLEDRQFGETTSKRLVSVEGAGSVAFKGMSPLEVLGDDAAVCIPQGQIFSVVGVLAPAEAHVLESLRASIPQVHAQRTDRQTVVVFPLDVLYARGAIWEGLIDSLGAAGLQWLVVGQTLAQLLSEVEQKLAISASRADEDEVDIRNVDRHTD